MPLRQTKHRGPPKRGPAGASEGSRACAYGAGNAPYAHPLRQPRCEGTRAMYARVKPWGVLSSGDSSLDKQRRVTQGAGAEPPAISF